MGKSVDKHVLKWLKDNYEKACNNYLLMFLNMNDLDAHYGFWVSDEVGGVYCYGDCGFSIGMQELIYLVENNISYEKYQEYLDYVVRCSEYGFTCPSFKSYYLGCPLVSQETFDKLDGMKKDIEDFIKETKEKF